MKNWQSENSSKFSFDYFFSTLKSRYKNINRLTVKFFERLFSVLSHMSFFITLQWFSGAEMDCVQTPGWDFKSQEADLISDPHLLVRPTYCPLLRPTTDYILSRLSCCFPASLPRPPASPTPHHSHVLALIPCCWARVGLPDLEK